MVVILMGVSGSGKTTLGMRLAGALGWTFLDADDFYSVPSADKMARGESLSDDDVDKWMEVLRGHVATLVRRGQDAILAFPGLKRGNRHRLTVDPQAVRFVYLKGSISLLKRRLRNRSGHFLRENLLVSQFAALEEPHDAVTIDIDERPGRIVDQIREALSL